MTKQRIYSVRVASVYPHYVAKAEKKGRTRDEVDQIILWLTGLDQAGLEARIADAVVIGTRVIQIVGDGEPAGAAGRLEAFLSEIRDAIDAVDRSTVAGGGA